MKLMITLGGWIMLGLYGLACLGYVLVNTRYHIYEFMPWWGAPLMFIAFIPIVIYASNVNAKMARMKWDPYTGEFREVPEEIEGS